MCIRDSYYAKSISYFNNDKSGNNPNVLISGKFTQYYPVQREQPTDIIFNAKTQRISVCNSCESLLIHRKIAKDFLPLLKKRLDEKQVEIRADQESAAIVPDFKTATEEDWGMEYLDYILSVKQVDSVEDAIEHINRYNTGHSEAIITKDYDSSRKFLDGVDAAAVYVNASTRFTDGFEFGFGAEIGISTQKLHARGPMGLKAVSYTHLPDRARFWSRSRRRRIMW